MKDDRECMNKYTDYLIDVWEGTSGLELVSKTRKSLKKSRKMSLFNQITVFFFNVLYVFG